MAVLVEDYGVEFPTFNLAYAGYKTRYLYCAYFMPTVPVSQEGRDNM